MFGKSFAVGTFFGVQLRIDYSWFIIFGLIAWSVTAGYVPAQMPGLPLIAELAAGLVITLLFFASVVAHEYAHSIVANRLGLPIRRITLFALGGASELHSEPPNPATELKMSAAGPLTSLAAGIIFTGLWEIGDVLHWSALTLIAQPLAILNYAVAIFNLLPAYPMDGGRILRSAIWFVQKDLVRATRNAARVGVILSYGLIGIGILAVIGGDVIGGLWLVIIGFFIAQSARYSYLHLLIEGTLNRVPVTMLYNRQALSVPLGTPLRSFIIDYELNNHQTEYIVTDEKGKPVGIIETDRLELDDTKQNELIDNYFKPIARRDTVSADDTALAAFQVMENRHRDIVPVVNRRRMTGVVERQNIYDYLTAHRFAQLR